MRDDSTNRATSGVNQALFQHPRCGQHKSRGGLGRRVVGPPISQPCAPESGRGSSAAPERPLGGDREPIRFPFKARAEGGRVKFFVSARQKPVPPFKRAESLARRRLRMRPVTLASSFRATQPAPRPDSQGRLPPTAPLEHRRRRPASDPSSWDKSEGLASPRVGVRGVSTPTRAHPPSPW